MELSIDQIIHQYGQSLFKICLGYANSSEDAEDMLQEVFVNVWKGLKNFRAESNIKTWLYRITVNTCLLRLRKKSIQTISLDNLNYAWISHDPNTSDQGESFEILHQLIQQLNSKDKSIILLYLEGLSHQEIATIVGITSNYVGVKINRIKEQLTNKIKKHG